MSRLEFYVIGYVTFILTLMSGFIDYDNALAFAMSLLVYSLIASFDLLFFYRE